MRLLTSLFILVFATSLLAQENDRSELGIGFGYSPTSTQGIGVSPDRQLMLATISYSHILTGDEHTVLKYRLSLVPAAFVRHGTVAGLNGAILPPQTTYGGGAEPVGLQVNWRRSKHLQPYVGATGGFLYFTDQVPVPESSRYNFTFSFGGGIELLNSGRGTLRLGYRFHHLSNGYTGHVNPGIDSHILEIGFALRSPFAGHK
jgi:lipid A 3-O-deacylase PagL